MRRSSNSPRHANHRQGLRTAGMLMVAVGAVFSLIGFASFFGAMGGGGVPEMFWCAFVGLPLLGFGTMCLKAGYMGSIARYVANETAPVAADTAEYLANETRGAVRTTAAAVAEGLRTGETMQPCPKCRAPQRAGANFCDRCGAVVGAASCTKCHAELADGARFCSACGAPAS